MRILNLFAGIGGNRSTWQNVEVTAIENNIEIANIYSNRFPTDRVICADVIGYYEKILNEYDFIWASPPCQSHSMFNMVRFEHDQILTPDMTSLYGIMTILKYRFKGKWVIENVNPWYKELVKPTIKLGRHYYWSNFFIPFRVFPQYHNKTIEELSIQELLEFHQIPDFEYIDAYHKRQILRNCVDYRIGQYILDCAKKEKQKTLIF